MSGTNLLIAADTLPGDKSMSQGDIIDVRKSTVPFGRKEGPPLFLAVQVIDAGVDEVSMLVTGKKVDVVHLLESIPSGCCCGALYAVHHIDKKTLEASLT